MDNDPESCLADDNKDTLYTEDDANDGDTYSDVGFRFRLVFMVSFAASALQVVIGTISSFIGEGIITSFIFMINASSNIVLIFIWIYGFICRFTHDGEVCSGDYLGDNDSTEGYLMSQGWFMKWFGYFFLAVLALFFLAGFFFAKDLYKYDKKRRHAALNEEEE